MKIVVNTRLLRRNRMDGIGWFTHNSLQRIVAMHPEVEFHFAFDSPVDETFLYAGNIVPHRLFPPAKHALLNIVWSEVSMKRLLGKLRPDLYFSPDGMLCLGWKGPQHAVIHDLNFIHHPDFLNFSNRKYYNHFFPRFARRASRIATVSEFSRQDIHHTLQVPGDKIDVVHCGINDFFHPEPAGINQQTRQKYTGGASYFLFVGTLSPRKNVDGLLQAFETFKQESGTDSKLLIAGARMFKTGELAGLQQRMKHGKDVVFTGRLPDGELNRVYAAALCLVYVPHFEGFGIPLVEAMQCDIPVIASRVTSLPEVAQDAALYVDPRDTAMISQAMMRIIHEPALRAELVEKGRRRKLAFTWDNTATLLWESLLRTQ